MKSINIFSKFAKLLEKNGYVRIQRTGDTVYVCGRYVAVSCPVSAYNMQIRPLSAIFPALEDGQKARFSGDVDFVPTVEKGRDGLEKFFDFSATAEYKAEITNIIQEAKEGRKTFYLRVIRSASGSPIFARKDYVDAMREIAPYAYSEGKNKPVFLSDGVDTTAIVMPIRNNGDALRHAAGIDLDENKTKEAAQDADEEKEALRAQVRELSKKLAAAERRIENAERPQEIQAEQADDPARDLQDLEDITELFTDEQLEAAVFAVDPNSEDGMEIAGFFLKKLANRDEQKAFELFRRWKSGAA